MSEQVAIVSRTQLPEPELRAVEALVAELRASGVDPRVSVEALDQPGGERVSALLAYAAGRMVGAVVPDRFGGTIEATLFTKPGAPDSVIEQLWQALLAMANRENAQRILLLHDRKAPVIGQFARQQGLAFDHAELVMRRPAELGAPVAVATTLDIRRAVDDDLPLIARITAEEWGSAEANLVRAREAVASGNTTYYFALHDGEPVTALNIQMLDGQPWVYGFQVRRPYRGNGFGRQVLTAVMAWMWGSNPGDMLLEVDPENTVAVNLYRSLGFAEQRTFDYWAKELADD